MSDLLDLGFDSREVEPSTGFVLLPPGQYVVKGTGSERKASGSGNEMLVLQWQVAQGEHAGATLFDRLNLWHPKDQVAQIAKRTLSSIARSVGIFGVVKDSQKLLGKPLLASVIVEDYQDKNGETKQSNRIRSYAPLEQPPASEAKAEAPKENKKPWASA